jgi:hypothetical protein
MILKLFFMFFFLIANGYSSDADNFDSSPGCVTRMCRAALKCAIPLSDLCEKIGKHALSVADITAWGQAQSNICLSAQHENKPAEALPNGNVPS